MSGQIESIRCPMCGGFLNDGHVRWGKATVTDRYLERQGTCTRWPEGRWPEEAHRQEFVRRVEGQEG